MCPLFVRLSTWVPHSQGKRYGQIILICIDAATGDWWIDFLVAAIKTAGEEKSVNTATIAKQMLPTESTRWLYLYAIPSSSFCQTCWIILDWSGPQMVQWSGDYWLLRHGSLYRGKQTHGLFRCCRRIQRKKFHLLTKNSKYLLS